MPLRQISKRIGNTIYLGLLLVVWALVGNAQVNNPSIISVTTAPSGSCSAGLPNQQVTSTGTQYSCQNVSGGMGTWAAIGGGGSGTVTAVTGTSPVTSTGGTAPAIACPTCGVTGSNLSQFATGGTIGPKIINGVSMCGLYTGATADVQLNACLTDAETRANGNTSGIADARGLGGAQTFSAAVKCGDTSSDPVKLLLPAYGTWTVSTQASSSDYDFDYFPGCVIEGNSSQPLGLNITHTAANGTSLGVLGPGPGVNPAYVNIGGFSISLNSTSVISNAAMVISGADNTIFHDMNISHFSGGATGVTTNGANGNGICCQAKLINITTNAQYSGGIGLDLEASSSLVLQGLSVIGGSFDHPVSPSPNVKCHSTLSGNSSVEFHGIYEETNKSQNTATMNVIDGCTGVLFDGFYPNDIGGSSTTTMISTTNAVNTNLVVVGLNPTNFNYGGIFVANGTTGTNTLFAANGAWSYFTQAYVGAALASSYSAFSSSGSHAAFCFTGTSACSGDEWADGSGASTSIDAFIGGSDVFNIQGTGPLIRPTFPLGFFTSGFSIDAGLSHDSVANTIDVGANQTAGNTGGSMKMTNLTATSLNQLAANNSGGKCTMATATSCTQTISHTFTTPVCIVTQQSATLTGGASGCTVSGTTVTVTSAVANAETWGFLVFGDPN